MLSDSLRKLKTQLDLYERYIHPVSDRWTGSKPVFLPGRRSSPKELCGLFGAAPSIALATIGLTIKQNAKIYAAVECRSMMLGAIAFFVYALNVSWVLKRYRPSALTAALTLMPVWFAVSFALWFLAGGPS